MTSEYRAFLLGFREGLAEGDAFGIGMTYDGSPDSPRSQAYDRGLTLGQRVAKLLGW